MRLVDDAKTRIAEISVEELKRRAVDRGSTRGSAASEAVGAAAAAPFLIDVREDYEVARSRIPKAVHPWDPPQGCCSLEASVGRLA